MAGFNLENTDEKNDELYKPALSYSYIPKPPIVEKLKTLVEKKKEEQLERERLASMPKKPFVREEPRVGRNDPCPCGSGKKYKKCCLLKDQGEGAGEEE